MSTFPLRKQGSIAVSDDGTIASGSTSEVFPPKNSPQPPGQADQLVAFVQEQPLTAALVALVLGYLLGKIT